MTQYQNVLITGASSGIGAAIAKLLAENNYHVWGTTRKETSAIPFPVSPEAAQRIKFVRLDVTDDSSVKKCFAQVMQEAGHIDVLINNAGYGIYGSIEDVTIELAKAQFETNVFGTLRMIRAFLPVMRQRGSGLIINVSSLAGKLVIPFQTHYAASKHAIEAFTEGLRQEVRPFGIKVAMIEPGDINTNFNNATEFSGKEESAYKKWTDASWKTIDVNLQKAPSPEVIAKKVLKIVRSQNPATRYPAGDFMSERFPFLARFLPDRVKEWAIRLFYNINF
ncbi:MAG TPA: hypothetical protein DHD79_08565 [Firmicutes bacterium]|jgi:short-subunit dehydrogenase|nr:hypothetical protein [Bacillota bacterium]HAZ22266.1 hypothetical protein [Bacillota bacterium]HBE07109.1 hypothetical protein [Bacillota bacterium]HBL50134.1 hypothetical protein [Bacillota bacterium]HBL68573.1 hypothetical protein [Bacillota bacterium]